MLYEVITDYYLSRYRNYEGNGLKFKVLYQIILDRRCFLKDIFKTFEQHGGLLLSR